MRTGFWPWAALYAELEAERVKYCPIHGSNTHVYINKDNDLYHLQLRVGDRGSNFVNAYLTETEMRQLQSAVTDALGVLNTPSPK